MENDIETGVTAVTEQPVDPVDLYKPEHIGELLEPAIGLVPMLMASIVVLRRIIKEVDASLDTVLKAVHFFSEILERQREEREQLQTAFRELQDIVTSYRNDVSDDDVTRVD